MRIAINGFGRIGKNFLRVLLADKHAERLLSVAAINIGPSDIDGVAYFFKYDSILKTYKGAVSYKDKKLHIESEDGIQHVIAILAEKDPALCNWRAMAIDWVVEATGKFTNRAGAQKHLDAGARHVLITAPADGEDITIIPGVNSDAFSKEKHTIVSLGSCTTNAFVPLVYVLEKTFGIEKAAMNTIHAYTNTQVLLDIDATSKDLRRHRAAALNIVPTSTGAMKVIDRIMPSLAGKITGIALRVPVPVVSFIDIAVILKVAVTNEQLQKAFLEASNSYLRTFLGISEAPLVSSDYEKSDYSVTLDTYLTESQGTFCKVFGWYDNEWGYCQRLKDFLLSAAAK